MKNTLPVKLPAHQKGVFLKGGKPAFTRRKNSSSGQELPDFGSQFAVKSNKIALKSIKLVLNKVKTAVI